LATEIIGHYTWQDKVTNEEVKKNRDDQTGRYPEKETAEMASPDGK